MKEITKYQTKDGKDFDTREKAEKHEVYLNLVDRLIDSPIYWRETSPAEFAEWLLENPVAGVKIGWLKSFMYFWYQKGGMSAFSAKDKKDFTNLHGWMSADCRTDDTAMLDWMETAEIGDVFAHRLGYLVRLKDEEVVK